jgi:hypothetical protein
MSSRGFCQSLNFDKGERLGFLVVMSIVTELTIGKKEGYRQKETENIVIECT